MADQDLTWRILGFQIQHILPREILTGDSVNATNARNFLNSVQFNLEAIGNKIPLLTDAATRNLFFGNADIADILEKAGFGRAWHFGSHPGYNSFVLETLSGFWTEAQDMNWSPEVSNLALFDLIGFLTDLNKNGIPPVMGTSAKVFGTVWETHLEARHLTIMPDYANLSQNASQSINTTIDGFETRPIDISTVEGKVPQLNSEARFEFFDRVINEAKASSIAGQIDFTKSDSDHARASADGQNPGSNTSASIALFSQFKTAAGGTLGLRDYVELAGSDLAANLPDILVRFAGDDSGSLDTDPQVYRNAALAMHDAILNVLLTVRSFGDKIADSINDFTPEIIETIGKNINAVLVGVGGSLVGDVVEFLNLAYPAIKKGIQTDNWTDLVKVTVEFGAAAVVSAVLVTVAVGTAGFVAGSVGAAFTAAGFAAYGLYEVIVNGAELLGNITADIADVISDIELDVVSILEGQENAGGLERVVDAVALIFAGARDPGNIAPFDFAYIVDNLEPTLPDAVRGTDENELFFGRNGAIWGRGQRMTIDVR